MAMVDLAVLTPLGIATAGSSILLDNPALVTSSMLVVLLLVSYRLILQMVIHVLM